MSAPERWPAGAGWVLAAVLGSGALFFLGVGQAIVPVQAATWLAPLPVLLLAPRVRGRVAATAAFAAMLLGSTNSWAFFVGSGDVPLPVGLGISVFYAATFTLVVGTFRRLTVCGRPVLATLAAPAVWVVAFSLFGLVSPIGLMGWLANFLDTPLVLQVASVTGVLGVDFVVLFVTTAVAALCAPGIGPAARRRVLALGVVLVVAALGFGTARLATADPGPAQRVALVVSNPTRWGDDVRTPAGRALLDGYVAQVAALPPGVDIAVLPEGALTVDDATLPAVRAAFGSVAQARGTTVVFGATRKADGAKYADAFVVPPDGSTPPPYLKWHDRVSPHGRDLAFVPGTPTRTGIVICGDVGFTDVTRAYGRAGAGLVLAPASDEGDNGWLHSRTAARRGLENGYAVAWPGQQGQLMISDRYGRVLADTPRGRNGGFTVAVADVPVDPGTTPYARFGDWFAWLCLVLVACGALAGYRGAIALRRSRRQTLLLDPR